MSLNITKSKLGKLLAEENIRIEHHKVSGPYFDVINRLLVLPLWEDMDEDLYDLFIGHEVAHALFTPAATWNDVVKNRDMNFKQVVNIVEDARIEKKIKRKFPGLARPMYSGYTQLLNRNFFSVDLQNMKHLPILDRINTHFKLGVRADISFTDDEQIIVNRIANAETFDEVLQISEELFTIAINEFQALQDDISDENQDDISDENQDYQSDSFENNITYESDYEISSISENDTVDKTDKEKNNNISTNIVAEKIQELIDNDKLSFTEDVLTKSQKNFINVKAKEYLYLKMPKALNISDWVIPYKKVHSTLKFAPAFYEKRNEIYNNFMTINKKNVSKMIQEFELKKNAKHFVKAKISKTGKLDLNKLAKITLTDDVFLQTTTIPNGKNHGMIMVIDMSGSMSSNMAGTIEQTISLAFFCRKLNIPFDVYAFSDNRSIDTNVKKRNDSTCDYTLVSGNERFHLKHLLSYKMSHSEFIVCVKNLLLLATSFAYSRKYDHATIPESMSLAGTPLNDTLLILPYIANKFRAETKVDILNTIILTDGDATNPLFFSMKKDKKNLKYDTRYIIQDHLGNFISDFNLSYQTQHLIKIYKKMTGSKVYGYFLHDSKFNRNDFAEKYTTLNELNSTNYVKFEQQYSVYTKHKYFAINSPSYDTFYIIPGNKLKLNKFEIKGSGEDKKKLFTEFKKAKIESQLSKVFISHFITELAVDI